MSGLYSSRSGRGAICAPSSYSSRKRSGGRAGRLSRFCASSVGRGVLGAFSALCLLGLGLAASPDGRGLLVGVVLIALLGGAARGAP